MLTMVEYSIDEKRIPRNMKRNVDSIRTENGRQAGITILLQIVFCSLEGLPNTLALLILFILTRGSRLLKFCVYLSALFLWIWALISSPCRIISFCAFRVSCLWLDFLRWLFLSSFFEFQKEQFWLGFWNITRRADAPRASLVPDLLYL